MQQRLFLGAFSASLLLIAVALGMLVVAACGDDDDAPAGSSNESTATPAPTTVVSPTATPGVSAPPGTATGPAEHEGNRALAIVEELTKAPRVSGTASEARAAEYLAGLLRSYGYSTEVMEFEFDGDRYRAGQIVVNGASIQALSLSGSPGGKVEAATAYVGLADGAGIGSQDLSGKIAVADRGTLNFIDKYANVKAKGAIGLIVVNHLPGPFSGNLTTAASFPVVAVAKEDGAPALDAAKRGATMSIEAAASTGKTKALNVLAKPTADSECKILVGGHFDSVPGAPGANDNASGASNVIELARALAVDGLDEGVCFAVFGAEESGLYGSKALVQRFKDEGELPEYMLNLDVTGMGRGVEVIGGSDSAREALRLAREFGFPAIASQLPANSGSDHMSFDDAGIETVFLTSGDFDTIHSPEDVFGDIDANVLDQIGDTGLAIVKYWLAEVARAGGPA